MTKAKSNVMTDFGAPIIVLVLICVIMSALLALTNKATAPVIAAAEEEANRVARLEVLPEADSFLQVEIAGLPEAVQEVYQAENGAGYTFSITTQGYGGKNTLKMVVGIDAEGKITGTKVLSQSETPGLGAKIVSDASFSAQFPGKDASYVSDIKNIDTISGATRSSNFYRLALTYAFEAFDMVKEAA